MPLPIMEGRYEHLVNALAGYQKTGVALIEYNGTTLAPSLTNDDIGLYCIIPKLATLLHTSVDTTLLTFFYGLSGAALISGVCGFFFLYRSPVARLFAGANLVALTLVATRYLDVYQMYVVAAVAFIPWILWFTQKKTGLAFYFFSFFMGLCLGFAHAIRTHAGTAVLLFFIILVLTNARDTLLKKLLLIAIAIAGLALPAFYFSSLVRAQRAYVQKNLPGTTPGASQHPLWHPLYLGFGFLANPFDIKFEDSCAHKKVMRLDPSIQASDPYPSEKSERLLRKEVIAMMRRHPLFFMHVLWAKIGILLFYFLLWANVGCLAAWLYPLPRRIFAAFFAALCFNSLFVLITMPYFCYLLGFFSCAALFGITALGNALKTRRTAP